MKIIFQLLDLLIIKKLTYITQTLKKPRYCSQKSSDNSILEQLEEVKKMKKNDYYAFKLSKSGKTSEEVCETTTI